MHPLFLAVASISVLTDQHVRYKADSRETAQAGMGVRTGLSVAGGGEVVVVGERRGRHRETLESGECG